MVALAISTAALCAMEKPAAADEARQLSGPETLALAEDLVMRGDLAHAQLLVDALERSGTSSVDQTQVRFLRALLARGSGDQQLARDIFREILETRPELVRVRLELARTLFLLDEDRAAEHHFRLALADAPNQEVERNIIRYLNAIEHRRELALDLVVGIVPDSNVSAGTTARTIELFGFLPAELSDDAREQSGLGLRTGASVRWLPRLDDNWRLELRAAGAANDYSGPQYDDVVAFGEFGVRRILGRGYVSAGLTHEDRWFAGEHFYVASGARIGAALQLGSRWFGFAAAGGVSYDYADQDTRDGPAAFAQIGVTYAPSSFTTIAPRISVSREETKAAVWRNTSATLQIGVGREFSSALTATVSPFIGQRQFDSFDPLFGVTREDERYGVALDVLNRRWSWRGYTPALTYTYTDNDSNVVIYDYDRHLLEFRITRTF